MEIIGLIPAGGLAKRMGRIPCSKEIFPLVSSNGEVTVASMNLIRYFKKAGITSIFYILGKGKWDIPEYFGSGSTDGVDLGYLVAALPYGTPFTLDQAYPFVKQSAVALGFPDILIEPDDAFGVMKTHFSAAETDLLLGVVPSTEYLKSDMLEFDENNKIKALVIKQNRPDLKFSWFGAIWSAAFTEFLHQFLADFLKKHPAGKFDPGNGTERELFVGDVIQAAIDNRLRIDYHMFSKGRYTDIGTPEAIRDFIL
jgi:glucose-1-phosphate thymidylyltransferase